MANRPRRTFPVNFARVLVSRETIWTLLWIASRRMLGVVYRNKHGGFHVVKFRLLHLFRRLRTNEMKGSDGSSRSCY